MHCTYTHSETSAHTDTHVSHIVEDSCRGVEALGKWIVESGQSTSSLYRHLFVCIWHSLISQYISKMYRFESLNSASKHCRLMSPTRLCKSLLWWSCTVRASRYNFTLACLSLRFHSTEIMQMRVYYTSWPNSLNPVIIKTHMQQGENHTHAQR